MYPVEIQKITTYPRGAEPSRARRRLRHGDTVMSTVRPDRGAYFLVLNPSNRLIASTGFAVTTPIGAPWAYLHAALTRSEVFEHLGRIADGGAYPAVNPDVIGAWQVPLPPDSVLNAFQCMAAPLYERMDHNRCESRALAAILDTLLPKLLSGETRVKDAERFIEATPHAV